MKREQIASVLKWQCQCQLTDCQRTGLSAKHVHEAIALIKPIIKTRRNL